MSDRIEAIRARHAAISASPAVADQQTKDIAWLLDLVGRQHDQFLELNKVIDDQQERIDDLNDEIADCEALEYKAQVERVEAVRDVFRQFSGWMSWKPAAARAAYRDARERIDAALAPVAPDAEPGGAQ